MLIQRAFRVMGGPARIQLAFHDRPPAEALIDQVVQELVRLECRYSRYRPDSLISRINAAAGSPERIPIDEETAGLCEFVSTLYAQTTGAFDPTAGVLTEAWDFRRSVVPPESEIRTLQALVGWEKVEWDKDTLRLPEAGMALDFGGIVKEYAADAAIRLLRDSGVESALVELAGDVATLGAGPEGAPWSVGVRHPRAEQPIGTVALNSMAIASSGDYERGAILDGERMSHCIDPRSGRPVKGPLAVSVISAQCLLAGAAATTAMLKPVAESIAWLESVGLPWMLVDRDCGLNGPLVAQLEPLSA